MAKAFAKTSQQTSSTTLFVDPFEALIIRDVIGLVNNFEARGDRGNMGICVIPDDGDMDDSTVVLVDPLYKGDNNGGDNDDDDDGVNELLQFLSKYL